MSDWLTPGPPPKPVDVRGVAPRTPDPPTAAIPRVKLVLLGDSVRAHKQQHALWHLAVLGPVALVKMCLSKCGMLPASVTGLLLE